MKEYKAAVYLRLSKEDNETNNSIDAQREITRKYAKNHNFDVIDEYIDNGYSGILSSRPALNRLIIDIVNNKINMVIVKDMSRLTRDKNITSYYTDVFFPENDVRLISVTEYIDTGERYEIDDIVSLRGIINQSYLEDISKKIKAVKRNCKEQGKFIEGSVAYGYKKCAIDKNKLVIDECVAPVIEEIYNLFLNGEKPKEIAEELNIKKIRTPSQYLNLKNKGEYWTKSMVNRILTNPIYAGNLVLNKYENNFKLKKRKTTSKYKYKILENTHTAIISQEDFNRVQEIKKNKVKSNPKTYLYLLKGLSYCKHCGRKMTYKNSAPVRIDKEGKITGKKNDKGYFICSEHYRHREICNAFNKIMEKELNEIVLNALSNHLKQLKVGKYTQNVQNLKEKQNVKLNDYKKVKNEISRLESEFKTLYSKKVEGCILEKEFLLEYDNYKKNISELKKQLTRLEKLENIFETKNDIKKIILEFENCKNFDNKILKKLIEKIEIGKNQTVEITFKV